MLILHRRSLVLLPGKLDYQLLAVFFEMVNSFIQQNTKIQLCMNYPNFQTHVLLQLNRKWLFFTLKLTDSKERVLTVSHDLSFMNFAIFAYFFAFNSP